MQAYRINLMGNLEVAGSGTRLTRFRTRKTALLLAYLAYHQLVPTPRDVLIEVLWPELDCDAARNNLSTALSSLRRQLELPEIMPGAVLTADRHSVQLTPGAVVTDVAEFMQTLRAANAASGVEKARLLEVALNLYSGPLLPDYEADWIRAERRQLENAYRKAQREWEEGRATQSGLTSRNQKKIIPASRPSGMVTFFALSWAQEEHPRASRVDKEGAFTGVAQAIAQQECRRLGGYTAESESDTFLAAFTSAADALECALACRKALRVQPLAEQFAISAVRMALHIGELEVEEDWNCNPARLLTLRLLAAAHGGQMLGTASLETLSVERKPHSHLMWQDLGEHSLMQGRRPERIYQMEAVDQPERHFPPLRAARLQTDTLPLPLNRFFGREAEVARLSDLLCASGTRLVTLTGMGGSGKTRLAIEVGQRVQATFPGLVWFVPLASLEDASRIPDALCRTLNLTPPPHADPFTHICEFLSRQKSPTLLILDNFEPFVEEGAEWVQRLLTATRNVTCLLTSRQSLEIPGEQEWPLLPLPIPVEGYWLKVENDDAPDPQPSTRASTRREGHNSQLLSCPSVQLFVNRAQAVRPDFQITPGNWDCIAQICIALEGIPLAIELATARAQVMTPHEMLAAIRQRFDFLSTSRRSVLPRHRALRATIDWSYERLQPELQTFFARLSVFRDGWTAQTAQIVCNAPEAQDWLQELRARSFVLEAETSGMAEMRFSMLETLREYGAEKLTPEDEKETWQRHLACFLKLAETASEQLDGPEQAQWLERLEAEYGNLRGALAWSLASPDEAESALRLVSALWLFFQVRGYIREGREYLQAALAQAGDQPTRLRAQALNGAGALAQTQGDYAEARAAYAQSLKVWQTLGHETGIATALNNLGLIAELQGDYAQAQTLYEQGLEIRQKIKDRHGLAASYNNLGILMQMRRDYAGAREWYARSLELKRELQQWRGVASTLNNLGNVAHALHDYDASRTCHEESLAIRQKLGEKQGIAGSLNNLGMVAESLGQYAEAQEFYTRSLAIKQELGDRMGMGMTLHNLGTLARVQGDLDSAHAHTRRSLQLHHEIGDRHGMSGGLRALALIAHAQGAANRAACLYAAYAALCHSLGMVASDENRAEQQQLETCLRAELGEEIFAQEQAAGTTFTVEQAIIFALSQ